MNTTSNISNSNWIVMTRIVKTNTTKNSAGAVDAYWQPTEIKIFTSFNDADKYFEDLRLSFLKKSFSKKSTRIDLMPVENGYNINLHDSTGLDCHGYIDAEKLKKDTHEFLIFGGVICRKFQPTKENTNDRKYSKNEDSEWDAK